MGELKNFHEISTMKNIVLEPTTSKQLYTIIDEIKNVIVDNQLEELYNSIIDHLLKVDYDNEEEEFKTKDESAALKALFVQWKHGFGQDITYDEFMNMIVNIIEKHSVIVPPSTMTEHERSNLVLTICSLMEYFIRNHKLKISDNVHNGYFNTYIEDLQEIIYKDTDNTIQYGLNINEDTIKDNYQLIKTTDYVASVYTDPSDQDLHNSNHIYQGKFHEEHTISQLITNLDKLINLRQEYNVPLWIHVTPIDKMNLTYYQPYELNKQINTLSTTIYTEFKFKPLAGITQIFSLRDTTGKLSVSLIYDDVNDNCFKLIYLDSGELHTVQVPLVISNVNMYQYHRLCIEFKRINNQSYIDIRTTVTNVINIPLSGTFDKTIIDYLELGFRVINKDKYDLNTINVFKCYNNFKYPDHYKKLLQ